MTRHPMTSGQLRAALRRMGWQGNALAADVRAFQAGWSLGPPLAVDGINGPLTRAAIRRSLAELDAGRCDLSPHFRFAEFACRCGGVLPGCRGVLVLRPLVGAAERYRQAVGGPVDVLSGYRCPERNRRVGGATSSQHLFGAAADVKPVLTLSRVRGLGVLSGIGYSRLTRRVRHIDVRHVSPRNPTRSTTRHPAVWPYSA